MGSLLAQNVILLAELAVGIITLVFLVKYVRTTKGIEKAANEQSEGLSKPYLTLRAIQRSPTIGENLVEILNRRMLMRAEPNAQGYLELINIGSGPALDVRCVITDIKSPEKSWDVPAHYVRPDRPLPLPLVSGNYIKGKQHKIICSYAGLSGNEYESVIELSGSDGDEIENFRVQRRSRA